MKFCVYHRPGLDFSWILCLSLTPCQKAVLSVSLFSQLSWYIHVRPVTFLVRAWIEIALSSPPGFCPPHLTTPLQANNQAAAYIPGQCNSCVVWGPACVHELPVSGSWQGKYRVGENCSETFVTAPFKEALKTQKVTNFGTINKMPVIKDQRCPQSPGLKNVRIVRGLH